MLEEQLRLQPHDAETFSSWTSLKALVLGGLLGGAIVAVVLWTMAAAGPHWWLVAWAAWMSFSLILLWAWPRWIAGMFNKFVAAAGRRAPRAHRCAARPCRLPCQAPSTSWTARSARRTATPISPGSGAKSASCSSTRCCSRSPPVQVEAVLAHELAHFKLKHIPQRLVVGSVTTFAGLRSAGLACAPGMVLQRRSAWACPVDSSRTPPVPAGAAGFHLGHHAAGAAWSRRHEFQADAFAARYSNGPELARALVGMYRENASTLTPDPLHSAFYDSHPPPVARIARLVAARARQLLTSPAASLPREQPPPQPGQKRDPAADRRRPDDGLRRRSLWPPRRRARRTDTGERLASKIRGRRVELVAGDKVQLQPRSGRRSCMGRRRTPAPPQRPAAHGQPGCDEVHRGQPRPAGRRRRAPPCLRPLPHRPLLRRGRLCRASRPLLILNKQDLIGGEFIRSGLPTSSRPTAGSAFPSSPSRPRKAIRLDMLIEQLRGRRTLLAGQSGVGKSSLTNTLCGDTPGRPRTSRPAPARAGTPRSPRPSSSCPGAS